MEHTHVISVGIFFDGTGNNGVNVRSDQKPVENNQSYYSDVTNIYKLFTLFEGNQKIYIEGIGTLTGAEDSNFAMATCKNPVGYTGYSSDDKLAKAFAFTHDKMQDRTREYQFYIYGFSRGAMLARAFCHDLLKKDSGILGNVKVKFLGLLDTVESTPFNNYNLKLLSQIENVLHLCSINECRYFFPLTGVFKDSKNMDDTRCRKDFSVWKEVFVPGAHADLGGGYLESSQSVYVSPNFIRTKDAEAYIADVRNTMRDACSEKIWNHLLGNCQIDSGNVFSQVYVARELVYNDLSKVYGKLLLNETNNIRNIFGTHFTLSDFEIDAVKHPFLSMFSDELEDYVIRETSVKPVVNYRELEKYTHISANFGLYTKRIIRKSENGTDAELINNGLNIPGHTAADTIHVSFKPELHLLEDGSVTDLAYGANVPNNNIWDRSVWIE